MMSRQTIFALTILGMTLGAVGTVAVVADGTRPNGPAPSESILIATTQPRTQPPATEVGQSGSTTTTTSQTTTTTQSPFMKPAPPMTGTAVVWSPGSLPVDVEAAVRQVAGVDHVTVVSAATLFVSDAFDALDRRASSPTVGWMAPIEVFAVDPADAPTDLLGLQPGTGMLSRSSAELRGIAEGGRLVLEDGTVVTIVGIVDDALLGAPELIIDDEWAAELGGFSQRSLLVDYSGDQATIERELRRIFSPTPMRFRGPGETPYLRHADAVLPQVIIKANFGEFLVRRSDGELVVDPVWFDENIVSENLPVVGSVTCHRSIMPLLESVLKTMIEDGNGDLIDPGGFQGCWNARYIANSDTLSRHSWGVAIDINHTDNPTGSSAVMPQAMIDAFVAQGFTWGGDWLTPDPAHFEWVGR